jgi:hypothetical protein
MWLSISAASLEMRPASSITICVRSVRGLRSSPCATLRSPAAFSSAVAAKPVRLAACASRLSFRREAKAISRRSTVVRLIASPVLAPLLGGTAHERRETNEIRAGCPRSPVLSDLRRSSRNSRTATILHREGVHGARVSPRPCRSTCPPLRRLANGVRGEIGPALHRQQSAVWCVRGTEPEQGTPSCSRGSARRARSTRASVRRGREPRVCRRR